MKSLLPLSWCALLVVPSLATAAEPSPSEWALQRVESGLVKPLSDVPEKRFSRGRPAPKERRARIPPQADRKDGQGRQFLTFAIDVRFGEEWREEVVGCVYRPSGKLFVKVGEQYRPAEFLLGKNAAPVAGACRVPVRRA